MYWDIGKLLSESQKQMGWGNSALEQLANDLKNDYPKVKGFSARNCRCMIQFYKEYNQELTIWQQAVAKLETSNSVLPCFHAPIFGRRAQKRRIPARIYRKAEFLLFGCRRYPLPGGR